MRIRSTKPNFWRSKTMARFDWGTRLVLKGLESYVDDNGVGKDDIALIAADVFPRDLSGNPHETLRQLAEAVQRLTEAGLVVRYEVDGEDLIYIDRWKEWQYIQHPKAGRFPRPDGTMEYKDDVNPESYRKPPADCMTGIGEQGSRGTGEVKDLRDPDGPRETDPLDRITEDDFPDTFKPIPVNDYPEDFEKWWQVYPRKSDKRKAFKAWKTASKRASQEQLIEGARRYAEDPNREDKYTKYPEGWLNGDGWLNEPLPSRSGPRYQNGEPMQGADLRAAENARIASLFSTDNPKAIGQ